eukprot:13145211-Alexandrium_andersonii.AAC.1
MMTAWPSATPNTWSCPLGSVLRPRRPAPPPAGANTSRFLAKPSAGASAGVISRAPGAPEPRAG